ncbi:MAG: acetylxylan esterase [bacterium]|nr:acetylxylan esterase [bacterium]
MINTQDNRRNQLYQLLGDLPERTRPISAILLRESVEPDYILEKLLLDLNGIEPVPAYFVRPKNATHKLPTILYNHSHGGNYHLGKEELLIGNSYLFSPPYAVELTRNGYAALCIDAWAFGERSHTTESAIFKRMLWNGQVLWGMMVYDNLRALDYLVSRPDVDANRIGTLGMSMGSTMSWWIAALDTRIKVCVDICCLTDFDTMVETNSLDLHGVYYYVPKLLKYFTTAEINALIAPRPHLSLAGLQDPLTPVAGLDKIDAELKKIYTAANATDYWKLFRSNSGHIETAEMRKEVMLWLNRFLCE